jgi:ribosomal protein S18 acetylase RimI-like enzyme
MEGAIMIIRPMEESDLDNCVAVVSGILGEPEDVTRDDIEDYMEWDQDEALLLIAESDEGAFLGFAALIVESWNRTARIEWIGLLPEARGVGTGSALMQRLEFHAERMKVRKIYVNTGVSNRGAISFYLSRGFIPEAVFRDWYATGSDAVWLALDLSRSMGRGRKTGKSSGKSSGRPSSKSFNRSSGRANGRGGSGAGKSES